MGIFDGLPIPPDKDYLRDELSRVDDNWAAARFDSLPHVVHILTSKEREREVQFLKEQSGILEDVVDEIVHAHHNGFNKAIQNYSQILRLFSESTESLAALRVGLIDAKEHLGSRSKQLHHLWYRSVTLRHIISLLHQIESISEVPACILKLVAEKQLYAAVQLHVQSTMMLEREGLEMVGAIQDIRSELAKLRNILFYKVLEELEAHLFNRGEYSLSFDGNDEGSLENYNDILSDENANSDENIADFKNVASKLPNWLSSSTPDEFVETIKKRNGPLHVKYLQTMVECLCLLGKVAAAGAIICQRLRLTIHDIITSKINSNVKLLPSSKSRNDRTSQFANQGLHFLKHDLQSFQLGKQSFQNGILPGGTLVSVSPVSPLMIPTGKAQVAAKELVDSILDSIVQIFENLLVVGDLLESKCAQNVDMNTPKSRSPDANGYHCSDSSQATGGYSISFSLSVLQSECQQLICEILRASPKSVSSDAAMQTARFTNMLHLKEKRNVSEDGLSFAFCFTDSFSSMPRLEADVPQGWSKRGIVLEESYGSAAVLPEQGIYLVASIYRPVLQFTDKVAALLPQKYSDLRNEGLLAFLENFVEDHFLPTLFVDYRKAVQQAISGPASFRPRAHRSGVYSKAIDRGRPVLQGLLAVDFLIKEVLGWAQALPKFAGDFVKHVHTFLDRAYEKCRASYMEAVLEKQSHLLVGRHDIDILMRHVSSRSCLPNLFVSNMKKEASNADSDEVEIQLSELFLNLQPIKQETLILESNKLILLACLSDSLEYVACSIESFGPATLRLSDDMGHSGKTLTSFANSYRKLATDCLNVLHVEMQLQAVFHLQEMASHEYMVDQNAEEPDNFIISLITQITRNEEEMAPFVSESTCGYIFGGISFLAAVAFIKALPNMNSINVFGVQQICLNSIALEQAIAAIPAADKQVVQRRFDLVRTYYELLNLPFDALLAFVTEHKTLFTPTQYKDLLQVDVPGREIPLDAEDQVFDLLSPR